VLVSLLRAPPALGEVERGLHDAPAAKSDSRADRGTRGSGLRVAVGAGTDFPIAVGARLEIEARSRLRISTSVGILPGMYVDAISAEVVARGGYGEETGDLVKRSLERAIVWRAHVGARVWRNLYLEVGYGLAALGGSATAGEVIAAMTGQPVPPGVGGDSTFDIESTLHMLDVEAGWDLALGHAWRLRVALGGAFTVAASSRIEPRYTPLSPEIADAFAREAQANLDDVYRSYVHVPVLSVSVSHALF
jgi:hypothetical protein